MEEKYEITFSCNRDDCDKKEKEEAFTIYKINDNSSRVLQVPYDTGYEFGVVQIEHQIYFTGGYAGNESPTYLKTTVVLNITSLLDDIRKTLADMKIARANHTLVEMDGKKIYAIGGLNDSGNLSSCEVYLIDKQSWNKCASLNEKRMWVSAISINGNYLYAFGGFKNSKKKASNIIECLNTTDKSAKFWSRMHLNSGADIWPGIYHSGIFQISDSSILIFGGIINEKETCETFLYDIGNRSIISHEKLTKKDTFYRTKFVVVKDELLALGRHRNHVFNRHDCKWTEKETHVADLEPGICIKSDTC